MDLTTVLSAMGGVGMLTFLQQAVGLYREERRKTTAEIRAQAAAPVAQQSMMLGMADQYSGIQQRTIASLEEQLEKAQREKAALAQEREAQERLIARLYFRIGQLEDRVGRRDP